MSTLGGLTPLAPLSGWDDPTPEATAEERLGGPADPRHAEPLAGNALTYPWERFPGETHGPYGMENGLLGVDIAAYETPAGYLAQDPTGDLQPLTNAAPWPKGVPQTVLPDEVAERRRVSADIHASNMGQSRRALYSPTLNAAQDDWRGIDTINPGDSMLVPIPQQVQTGVGGFGSTDRTQSMANQNRFGFDSAHTIRRYAAGSIPGNHMWMQPGSRPLVKSIPGTAQIPVGVDSPFTGQNPGDAYDVQGSVLSDLPAQYAAPPDPALAADYSTIQADPQVSYW